MITNEETTYQGQKQSQSTEQRKNQKLMNGEWQKVTISGVTGILIGAGATSAVYEMKANSKEESSLEEAEYVVSVDNKNSGVDVTEQNNQEEGRIKSIVTNDNAIAEVAMVSDESAAEPNEVVVHVYHHIDDNTPLSEQQNEQSKPSGVRFGENEMLIAHVDDNMSFAEAFAAARTQVGAGGAFHWHGGTYSTYYENEWDSMSGDEKHDFAHRVSSEVSFQNNTNDIAEVKPQPEVHYLGQENGTHIEGSGASGLMMEMEGKAGGMIDTNGDGVYDISFGDENGDGKIQETEVQDISDTNMKFEQFASESVMQDGKINLEALNQMLPQQDVSQEPIQDYTDDADLGGM